MKRGHVVEDDIDTRQESTLMDDDILTELQYQDEVENASLKEDNAWTKLPDTEEEVETCCPPAPIKRRRDALKDVHEENNRKRVRRKLFAEEEHSQFNRHYNDAETDLNELKIRPTVDRFVYGDEVLDLRSTLPGYEGASVVLTNVYNTFIHIVHYKSTLLSLKNRKLAIQLRAAEHHLRQLEKNNYLGAHVHLPRMVESLFSMLDYRNNPIYINQMKPVSCVLSKKLLLDHISFRSMEATVKNNSSYIELVFNNPFRFIFVGCAKREGPHKKNVVSPFPFFGEYINKAINEMSDVMYELVSKEIKRAKKELAETDQLEVETGQKTSGPDTEPPAAAPNNSLQKMESFSKAKISRDSQDVYRLHSFLRSVNMPLAKRETVDIIVTSGNSGKRTTDTTKMSYLIVENDKEAPSKGCLKMVDDDVTEDSIYMSSYIRCRVLLFDQQAAFGLQIYTRHAIKLLTIDDCVVKFSEFLADESQPCA